MIHFVVGAEGSFSMRYYLDEEGIALHDSMRVVLYDELARLDRLPLGTWVFSEVDRLSEAERDLATAACERLETAKGAARVMNHPRRALLRHDLLRAAHDAGINRFRSWRATEIVFGRDRRAAGTNGTAAAAAAAADALRYPVFVRYANRHSGNLTPLLDSPRQLEKGLASLMSAGRRLDDLLVIEFCDTKDEHGVYRKYSVFNIGDRVVPRYMECSRDWMVKWDWRIFDRVRADEETRYLKAHPHESWIREIFALAKIEYGRLDYGILDGAPQVWEINTNPTIGRGPGPIVPYPPVVAAYNEMLAPTFAEFYPKFEDAWRTVDTTDSTGSVEFDVPPALRRSIEAGARQRRRSERVGAVDGRDRAPDLGPPHDAPPEARPRVGRLDAAPPRPLTKPQLHRRALDQGPPAPSWKRRRMRAFLLLRRSGIRRGTAMTRNREATSRRSRAGFLWDGYRDDDLVDRQRNELGHPGSDLENRVEPG